MDKLTDLTPRLRVAALAAAVAALSVLLVAPRAHAAGGAFAVDDSEVGKPGECKVETWAAFAGNGDRLFAVAPACVVDIFRAVELGAQLARSRSGGIWGTDLAVKGKTNFISIDDSPFGIGLAAGSSFDLIAGRQSNVFVSVPVTFKLGDKVHLNLNGGWLYDRTVPQHVATWGAGFEWTLLENSMTVMLIGEMFGQSVGTPGTQIGLRFTPHKKFDIDLIYGRNLTGEHANWFTVGLNLRFGGTD